jgi:hypothetical protein
MKLCWSVVFVCNVIAMGQSKAQRYPAASEQTVFTAEDDRVEKPVPIPGNVMALLMGDDFVKDQLQNESILEFLSVTMQRANTAVFRFNGTHYVLYRKKSGAIR